MKLLVLKASDDNFAVIDEMYDILTLYKKYGDFIIEENVWKGETTKAITVCFNVAPEIAKQISECDFSLTIYDDYIE